MSTGRPKDGDTQLAVVEPKSGLPPRPPSTTSTAIVEYEKPAFKEEEEDLEVKLRRIIENVPVRVSNTSGSSAGSGSGDFHQYRQMRRKEQDRLARMDVDYQKRKEIADLFILANEQASLTAMASTDLIDPTTLQRLNPTISLPVQFRQTANPPQGSITIYLYSIRRGALPHSKVVRMRYDEDSNIASVKLT
ncbi:hypothetical protein GOBAR_AA32037 [Gossypium barbadense]|uniref:Uncharacterized protein n=1 Tax=Gossypium barbadense TaxID=3634 RepID=A0A2P5WC28_GOSBA|nr:hypothetical protein GOBAR_AA32037 [Gossypium barbadense]